MNRRGFLGRVIGALAAVKIAPKLVEVPKARGLTLTLPPPVEGQVIRIRMPQRFVVTAGSTYSPQSLSDHTVEYSATTRGWASESGTLKKGDVFTVNGVYHIN